MKLVLEQSGSEQSEWSEQASEWSEQAPEQSEWSEQASEQESFISLTLSSKYPPIIGHCDLNVTPNNGLDSNMLNAFLAFP